MGVNKSWDKSFKPKLLNLSQLEENFGLAKSSEPHFFPEWRLALPELTASEKQQLDEVKIEFAHLSEQDVLAPIVKLVVLSPLLRMAGFFLPPFRITAEKQVELVTEDEGLLVRGLIDLLVFRDQLWVVTIEAKRAEYSLKVALPQLLLYMMASPSQYKTPFGLVTNGSEFRFVKLMKQETALYATSNLFAIDNNEDLYEVVKILKCLGQIAQSSSKN
jgi:Type I restriction enzyme R protein N terminus (HSDR_N)